MRIFTFILALVFVFTNAAAAQEDDKGFIAGLLEDSLAGEGRTVQINGFRGALSKRATVSSIVILDDEGPWLRMDNLALQLNRSALLRGRVEVEELSAERIELSRPPIAPESDLPPAEAQGFSLPELPVSIDIQTLRAEQIVLGEPVLGEEASFDLTAALSLIGGEAKATLNANRTDQKQGRFEIAATYDDSEQLIDINIVLDEGEGGIAARLLALPENPSVRLSVEGTGSLNDFGADISIATDGTDRLGGTIRLGATEQPAAGGAVSRAFEADIGGDVTALFAPQYRPFFGDDVSLKVAGTRGAIGDLDITALNLRTEALTLEGSVSLNRDYWPTVLDLKGRIANEAGTPVTLPVAGGSTRVREALLDVQFDHDNGDAWVGSFNVTEFERDQISVETMVLKANGTLTGQVNSVGSVNADIAMDLSGIDTGDEDLQRAVGDAISGSLNIAFIEGQPLKLSVLNIAGTDYALTGDAEIADLAGGLETTLDTQLIASDISRFSGLAGSDLNGAVDISLSGNADLGGEFDLSLAGAADDLKVGQDTADKLLRGTTEIAAKAIRNSVGTRLDDLVIRNNQLGFEGSAFLDSDGADVKFEAVLNETGELAETLEGPATVTGSAKQRDGEWSVDVNGSGPLGASADIKGLATGPNASVTFDAKLPDIAPLVPNYQGAVAIEGTAFVNPEGWNVDTSLTGPYDLAADVEGLVTGPDANVVFTASMPNIKPLVPQYSGPVFIDELPEILLMVGYWILTWADHTGLALPSMVV